jgi:hypothetical protein
MRFFPRWQKEFFVKLSGRNPSTIAAATQESVLKAATQEYSPCLSSKQLFRPCALGLIGLAIAVALWGFGYKLSLYHRHATPLSRVTVAKLWIEPRDTSVAAASSLKSKSHLIPVSQALPVPIQRIPHLSRTITCILPLCTRGVVSFDFLIPFRSPPPYRFRLA